MDLIDVDRPPEQVFAAFVLEIVDLMRADSYNPFLWHGVLVDFHNLVRKEQVFYTIFYQPKLHY